MQVPAAVLFNHYRLLSLLTEGLRSEIMHLTYYQLYLIHFQFTFPVSPSNHYLVIQKRQFKPSLHPEVILF